MYLGKLSDTEKTQLITIKEKITERRSDFGECKNTKGRKSTLKGRKQMDRPMKSELHEGIRSITDAHPQLNESYIEFVEQNKGKWIDDIQAIHKKNNVQPRSNRSDNTGIEMFFTRAANPDWLILWDPSNPISRRANSMSTWYGDKKNMRQPDKRKMNRELPVEIKSFVIESIIPVISEERVSFENQLSADEKTSIETARQKIEFRKRMFKNWHESADFENGKCARDPGFDGRREDMRDCMGEIRDIAMSHSDEISNSLDNLKSYVPQWEKEITEIANKNNLNSEQLIKMMKHQIHKSRTPVAFLLFNPDDNDETELFGFNNSFDVIVYPNPVVQNAIVAVIGAVDKNIEVTLFTKEGETLRSLYNGLNTEQRLEVVFEVSELNNGIYLVKVDAGDEEITRKVVVK